MHSLEHIEKAEEDGVFGLAGMGAFSVIPASKDIGQQHEWYDRFGMQVQPDSEDCRQSEHTI